MLYISALTILFLSFSANAGASVAEELAKVTRTYEIRRGDNLTRIAKQFGVTIEDIISENRGNQSIKGPDLIWAGEKILIPPTPQVRGMVWELAMLRRKLALTAKVWEQDTKDLVSEKNQVLWLSILLIGVGAFGIFVTALWMNAKKEKEKNGRERLALGSQIFDLRCSSAIKVAHLETLLADKAQEWNEALKRQERVKVVFETEDWGSLEFPIVRTSRDKKGKIVEEYVACAHEKCDVVDLKPGNCLSHYSKQHG